ncbi:adhesin Lsa14 [Leptospira yasudae]|uniref:TRL-like family protein n=1 Tax=Leptospira yasudae TaxID=2202201 RepID=A0A6N4QHX2_9LEPT|nr:TRL-like family protein [Leptospira yasudae]TGL78711.1 TRL-like family protein [Leptospira yasudae]TGL78960.1 TRL-like family protein [Leptospira yasudae]TGL82856.1 TRL-like family protein [Leptospira yasudae]
MKLKSLLAIGFVAIWAVQCTGINSTLMFGLTPNTNPTKNYAQPYSMATKGGLLVHNGTIPGPIGHNAEGTATGSACSRNILSLVAFGDSSIEKAKAEAKISKVASVDYEQFAVLGIVYHSFCTVVTGSNVASKPDVKPVGKTK